MKIWGALLLALILFLPNAEAVKVRFETHTFMPSLQMQLDGKDSAPALNLTDMLEIEDISTQLSRLYLNDDFRISYLDLDYAGKKPLILSNWGDLSLDSSLGLRYWGLGWFAPLVESEKFKADFLIEVKSYEVDGQLGAFFRDTELVATQQSKFSGVAPVLGIALQGNVTDNLFLYTELAGLPLGRHGYFWEFDAGFQYKVKDHTFMQIGYKSFDLKTNNQIMAADLTTKINGPYFGLNFSL